MPRTTLVTLPFDVLYEIIVVYDKYTNADLSNIRLVSRELEPLASARLFSSLRISRFFYHRERFFNLASSPRVLPHVTQVSWLELPDFAPPLYSAWHVKAGNGSNRAYRQRNINRSNLFKLFWFPEPDLVDKSINRPADLVGPSVRHPPGNGFSNTVPTPANAPGRRDEDMKWRAAAITNFLPRFLAAIDRMPNLYRLTSQPLDVVPKQAEDVIATYILNSRQTCSLVRLDMEMFWLWYGWLNLCSQDGRLTNAVQAGYIDDFESTWAEYFDVSTVHSNDGFFTFLLPALARRNDGAGPAENRHITRLGFRQDLCWYGADARYLPAHGLSQLNPSVHAEAFSRLTDIELGLDGVRFAPSCHGNIDKLAGCLQRARGLESLTISWRFGGGNTHALLQRLTSSGGGNVTWARLRTIWPKLGKFSA